MPNPASRIRPAAPAFRLLARSLILLPLALLLAAAPAGAQGVQAPKASLGAGLKAYQAGELVSAYKLLKRALVEAKSDQDRASANLYLGLVYMAWDQKKLAEEAIAQAAALDPLRKLDPVEFPPEVIALYAKSRPMGMGEIAVKADPPGALIMVDGKEAGLADGASVKAAPGLHDLTIFKEGYAPQTLQVTVEEYGKTAVSVNLERLASPMVMRHSPPGLLFEGQEVRLSAEVSGGSPPARVLAHFRKNPADPFQELEMAPSEGGGFAISAQHGARAGELFEYYITAMDSAGASSNAGSEDRPLAARVAPRDVTPPRILHAPPSKVSDEEPLSMSAGVVDDSPLASVKLFIKRGWDKEYSWRAMAPLGEPGNYVMTIPAQLLEVEEIFYYLEATDAAGNFRTLGDAQAPFIIHPIHLKPRMEAQVTARESAGGKPGKKVAINAGSLRGYAKGDFLFAINFSAKPQGGASETAQELAGEIVVVSVEPASLAGEVIREYYKGAVKAGSAVRKRPSPPREVAARSETFETALAQWKKSPDPETKGYLVHRAEKLDGEYRVIAKLEGRETETYLDKGEPGKKLLGGERYFYRLKAFNSSGALSDFSVTAPAVVLGGPRPPAGFTAQSGLVGRVRLAWIPNSDPDTEGYRIYRSEEEKGEYKLIDEIPDPRAGSYDDVSRPEDGHGFREGTAYWYKALAYDKLGRMGQTTPPAAAASMGKPPAPANLRVESAGRGSTALAWDPPKNADAAGYRIYRSASRDGVFEMVAQISGASVSRYSDSDSPENILRPDIDYYYKITLFNQAGAESEFSEPVAASSKKPLAPPSHMEASVGLERKIVVTWEPSTDEAVEGYQVYRGATPGEAIPLIALPGRETGRFEDMGPDGKGLPPGAVYYYSARPATSGGVVGESAEWARGSTRAVLAAPENLKVMEKKSGEVILEWSRVKNGEVSGYRILKSVNKGEFTELTVAAENYYVDAARRHADDKILYKVQAIDMEGVEGALSQPAAPAPKPAPSPPTGLAVSAGLVSAALTWDAHQDRDVTGYEILIFEKGAWAKAGDSKSPEWLAEELKPGAEYEFAVVAVDSGGRRSAPSEPVRTRTLQ